jgi:hypothetical protein
MLVQSSSKTTVLSPGLTGTAIGPDPPAELEPPELEPPEAVHHYDRMLLLVHDVLG